MLQLIGVNLSGVLQTAKYAIPRLETADRGSFVAVSSDAGPQGRRRLRRYSASKHGVIGLFRSLASYHGPTASAATSSAPLH